jgi:hypothetical protein
MAEEKAVEPKKPDSLLDLIKAWLPILTVVGASVWAVYTYVGEQKRSEDARLQQARVFEQQRQEQQKESEKQRLAQAEKDAATRRVEAQKPYLELQFKTYLRTTALVGKLIVLNPKDSAYLDLRREFDVLYWTELALVEDREVAGAMVFLNQRFKEYEQDPEKYAQTTRGAAISLAHAIRDSIRKGWQGEPANK